MLTEAYVSNQQLLDYYGEIRNRTGQVAQMPLNFGLISAFERNAKPESVRKCIQDYLTAIGPDAWPNFNMGNHDQKRIGTRMGQKVITLFSLLYAFRNSTLSV